MKGTFAVEMYPDRACQGKIGLDFNAIAELVDYFHVPLSSRDYLTMYWVDMLGKRLHLITEKSPLF